MSAVQLEKYQALHEMIYNELIGAILRIIHKLDLTSHKENEPDLQVWKVHHCFHEFIFDLIASKASSLNTVWYH